jgi:hypothetical protein
LKYLIILILLLFGLNTFSQTVIKGHLKNETDKPVENANIILYEKKSDNIVAYSLSDQKGNFIISLNDNTDSLRLEVSLIGFDKLVKSIINKQVHNLNLTLHPSITILPDVVIKQEPIQISGDTISYNTKSFSDKSDRVIIDVIKKIPGIKVTETGQILFNNKAINKFYIEGKDLLENRYSIASNSLPSEAVDQIQVLQDHQPITLLNGNEESDRAAINIKLNKNSKMRLLGNGQVGIGLSPLLADNSFTGLKFTRDIQYINSVKYNNTGVNLDKEIMDQNFSNNLYISGSLKQDLVSLVKASVPPVDQARYWFNNNTLATGNYLIGINKTFDIKFNVALEHDRIKDNANSLTKIYLPKDTITIGEDHNGLNNYSKLLAGLVLQANTKKIFFRDAVQFQRVWSNATDYLMSPNINQQLNNPFVNLMNDFAGLVKLGNTLVGINSYTAYNNLPQRLQVTPGQFLNILNSGQLYDGLLQKIQLKGFFTDNSASFSKKNGSFFFTNKIGVLVQLQNLNNNLGIEQNNLLIPLSGNFKNEIQRNRIKLYDDASLNIISNLFNFSFGLKTSFNTIENTDVMTKMNLSRFFLNPNLNILYKFSSFWESSITASILNNIGYDANPTFILQNYRNLSNNDIPQRETKAKSISYRLGYKNIINAVYSNLDISYSKNKSNITISTTFDGILSTRKALLQDNPSSDLILSWNISKYYLALKTSFDLSLHYNKNKSQQLQQGVLNGFYSNTYIVGTRITSKVGKSMIFEHSLDLTVDENSSNSVFETAQYGTINFLKQNFIFKYFLPKNFQTNLNLEHYYNTSGISNGMSYFFADFSFKKKLIKPKIDFSVMLSNIFNTKSYNSYFNDTNFIINSNYTLRGRMLMIKAGFQF